MGQEPVHHGPIVKIIELRRNSQWAKSSATLSEAGARLIDRARSHLGGPYHAYYSSPSRRCRATLEALGFPTYREVERFGRLPKWFYRFQSGLVLRDGTSAIPFLEGYLAHPEARQRLLRHGTAVVDQVKKVARRLVPGGRALVLTHLLTIELTAMMARGDENPAAIGAEIRPLEGVALDVDQADRVTAVRVLRLPDSVLAELDAEAPAGELPPISAS